MVGPKDANHRPLPCQFTIWGSTTGLESFGAQRQDMYYIADTNSRTDVIVPGAQSTAAYGINDVNVVISNFSLPGSPATHGFVLYAGTFHDRISPVRHLRIRST